MFEIRLSAARVNAGITQKEAAAYLGISTRTVRRYEVSGNPPMDVAAKMTELYHVPLNKLYFGTKAAYRKAYMEGGSHDDNIEAGSPADG